MAKQKPWVEVLLKNRGSGNTTSKAISSVQNVYDSIVQNQDIQPMLTGPMNKLWRARILINRQTSGMEKKDSIDESLRAPTKTTHESRVKRDNKITNSNKANQVKDPLDYSLAKKVIKTIDNKVYIINPHTKPVTKVEIQYFSNMEVNPESTWASIKSMGRNNPQYMFTGSEDTLSFEISWRALDSNREDVINKCRLLESFTKANGYLSSPPTLWIMWGNSNLFKDDYFILKSAPYKPSNFQNSYLKGNRKSGNYEIVDLKLLPNIATQTLTFNRVTSKNLTHEDIIPISKLMTTTGVTIK